VFSLREIVVIKTDEKDVERLLDKIKYIFLEYYNLTLSGEPVSKDALNYVVSQAKKINKKFKTRKDMNELRL
jgi:hypothetical protein